MNEKKKSSNWYIAATYLLTVLFPVILIIVLVGLIRDYLIFSYSASYGNGSSFSNIGFVVEVLVLWFATKNASNFINKKYIIVNGAEIAKLATVGLLILEGIGIVYTDVISGIAEKLLAFNGITGLLASYIPHLIFAVIFYFTSVKYLTARNISVN